MAKLTRDNKASPGLRYPSNLQAWETTTDSHPRHATCETKLTQDVIQVMLHMTAPKQINYVFSASRLFRLFTRATSLQSHLEVTQDT